MESYFVVKYIHIATAIITITGFLVRGVWMIQSSPLLHRRWVKIAPHVNDTILLVSAIVLVILTHQYPGPLAWINAKIIALILYIGFGTVALYRGKTLKIRITAWILALLTFIYIVIVAFSKNALPFDYIY